MKKWEGGKYDQIKKPLFHSKILNQVSLDDEVMSDLAPFLFALLYFANFRQYTFYCYF